jgi:uncharacterized membrane protein
LATESSACPIVQLSIRPFLIPPMLILVLIVIVEIRRSWDTGDSPEPTPNECGKGGVIYYNREDSAPFVEKRTGFGYTVNFGNRWSWALIVGLLAVIGSTPLLL